jgi:hypothetical protein
MRRIVLLSLALVSLGACGTSAPTTEYTDFARPNALMGEEIENRIAQIPFQHRGELYDNLIWLSQRGEQAVPALLQGLKHAEPKVRSNCAFVLATIGDRRVIPFLQTAAGDDNEVVRLEIARSLVQMGDLKYAPTLIEGLDSERFQVRYYCHETLRAATGRDFGFDHLTEDVATRRQAVLQWRQWWAEQSGDRFFASEYARRNALTGEAPAVPTPPAPQVEPMPFPDGTTQPPPTEPQPPAPPKHDEGQNGGQPPNQGNGETPNQGNTGNTGNPGNTGNTGNPVTPSESPFPPIKIEPMPPKENGGQSRDGG